MPASFYLTEISTIDAQVSRKLILRLSLSQTQHSDFEPSFFCRSFSFRRLMERNPAIEIAKQILLISVAMNDPAIGVFAVTGLNQFE